MKDKLKLDCSGCGSSLFQTSNPQIYMCSRCETSFKISFSSDGISITEIEKKVTTLIEDYLNFKENLKNDKLELRCTTCKHQIFKTSNPEIYECDECQAYFMPIFEENRIKLVKPDEKVANVLDLKKQKTKLYRTARELEYARDHWVAQRNFGWFIYILGLLLIVVAINVSGGFGSQSGGELFIIGNHNPRQNTLEWVENNPLVMLIYPIWFIIIWRQYKSGRKKNETWKQLRDQKNEILRKIDSIEYKLSGD